MKWTFLFHDGYGRQYETSNPDDLIKWFDSHMLLDSMLEGKNSRFMWGHMDRVLEVKDEHKGTLHLEDVTEKQTWWMWGSDNTIYIVHNSFWFSIDKPGSVVEYANTSDQMLDLVWGYMLSSKE